MLVAVGMQLEVAKDSLDWIGLDFELDPDKDQFEYEIEIFG